MPSPHGETGLGALVVPRLWPLDTDLMIQSWVTKVLKAALSRLESHDAAAAAAKFPEVLPLLERANRLHPKMLAVGFDEGSLVPAAAVCIRDLAHTVAEARYAMLRAAHHCPQSAEDTASAAASSVFFQRFYLDDAALRIYAAAEHLVTAVTHMFGLSEGQLRECGKGRQSRPILALAYLERAQPESALAISVRGLLDDDDWKACRRYRNAWVHDQPPAVEGLGISFRRRKFWERPKGGGGGGRVIFFGGGDPPQYTVEQIHAFSGEALSRLLETSEVLLGAYYEVLIAADVDIRDDGSFTVKV